MRIWLITPYNRIPGEFWGHKHALVTAQTLYQNGHQVLWWTANFSHFTKKYRSKDWADIIINPNFTIRLVPVTPYHKHVGLARLRSLFAFSWRLYHRALQGSNPDAIILPIPNPTVDYVAVRLAKHFRARLIIDLRDLWPELWRGVLPRSLRPLASFLFYPFYSLRRYAFRNADALTAVCNTYLQFALNEAPHLKSAKHEIIYCGVDVESFRTMMKDTPGESPLKIEKKLDEVWAIYAGTLGNNYDIETILNASLRLSQRSTGTKKIKLLIAGDGPLRQDVVDFIARHQLTNISYIGVLPMSELCKYYGYCDIGLTPYAPDSTVVFPAKAFDYLAAGLPIINSIGGELEQFLRDQHIGVQYTAGDADSLADAFEKLASSDHERQIMARNSYNAAMQFDEKTQYRKLLNLLE